MLENKEEEFHKKIDLRLWKRMLKEVLPWKKQLIFLAVIMVAVGLLDALFALMTRYAVDHVILPGAYDKLWTVGALYGALAVVQGLNVVLLISVAGRIEMDLSYNIRRKGFRHLQKLSFSYFDKTPAGWILSRLTSDVQKLGETISWGLVDSVWGLSMMTLMGTFMFVMNWKLALVALAVLPVLILASIYFQQKILGAHRKVRKTNSRISAAYNEGITGVKTTKTLVREKENLDEFSELTRRMNRAGVRAAWFTALYQPVVMTLGSLGTALVLWRGGVSIQTGVSYGTLMAFIAYTVQFFDPVRELARVLGELQAAQAAAERVLSLLDTVPEISDSGDVLRRDSQSPSRPKGNLEFSHVDFWYNEKEKILENFNLKINAGETIALVGETGSGKSTLVNLACRFYEPCQGEVRIDGEDYRTHSQLWLQQNLGYVLQTPRLFSTSIRENIRYGRLDASNEEVEAAARLVNAHDFILRKEKGYDTPVGEDGALLSAGEKQLISFARAILADPVFFVLDEATSSVDTESERLIQKAIGKVLEGRTSFMIAHRLSTIQEADRILVLRGGRIEEEGTHLELMSRKGYYYSLFTA